MPHPISSRARALVAALTLVAAILAAPAAPAAAQTAHPDVVRLHDGTMLRGTISEQTAEHLVIVLPTGEVRTYPMSAVASAGPASPPAAPPIVPAIVPAIVQAPAGPPLARLRVTSDQQELSLQQLQGTTTVAVWTGRGVGSARIDQFSIICNAPCDTEIPAGTYQLGVAQSTGDARRAGAPIDLRGDVNLHVRYDDRTMLRVAGWLTFGLATAGATGLLLGSFLGSRWDIDMPMLVSGCVLYGLGMAVGFPLGFLNDAAEVEIRF